MADPETSPEEPSIGELVGNYVRTEAYARRIRQQDLAAEIGVSRATLTRKFGGTTQFDVAELDCVASRFGLPLDEMFAKILRSSASSGSRRFRLVENEAFVQLTIEDVHIAALPSLSVAV